MAISKIKLPDNSVQDIHDARGVDTKGSFYFVDGSSSAAGSSTSGSYLSVKWEGTVPGVSAAYDGLKIAYRIATRTGVSSAGVVLSIDNGAHYYPVVIQKNTMVTTHYPVGATFLAVFNSTQTATAYLTAGTKSTVTGCWQIMEYDSNTNTYQREYVSTGNEEYPITTRYSTTTGETYYAEYGRYSEGVTLNPSTNAITASKFKLTGGTSSQFLKADGTTDSNTYAIASNVHDVEIINVGNIDLSIESSLPSGTHAGVMAAYNAGKQVVIRTGGAEYVNDYILEAAYLETGNEDFTFASFYGNLRFTLYSNDNIYCVYGIIPDEYTVSGWGFTKNTGTLTGVKFNNTDATVSNGVASITASIPTKVSELQNDSGYTTNTGTLTGVTFNGSSATVSSGVAAITASVGDANVIESVSVNGTALTVTNKAVDVTVPVTDVTVGGTSVLSSGTAVIPAIPTVPTNVSSFNNDANYVKYVLCADEATYTAIQNKDSGTLYLIPES